MRSMRMFLYVVGVTTLIFTLLPGNADANKYQNRANKWCADYMHQHPGKKCRVKHRGKLCPRGFRRAHKFGRIGRGYKSCIPGKKGKIVQHGLGKAGKAVLGGVVTPFVPRHVGSPGGQTRPAYRTGSGGGLNTGLICVPHVHRQVANLHHKDANKLAAWSVIGRKELAGKVTRHKLKITNQRGLNGLWQLIPNQLSNHHERCHIQGIQRLSNGPYAVVDYLSTDLNRGSKKVAGIGSGNDCEEHGSDWGGAHLAVIRLGSKHNNPLQPWGTNLQKGKEKSAPAVDRVVADISLDPPRFLHYHPSGFQTMGNYLAVAMYGNLENNSRIDFIDMSSPEHPRKVDSMNVPDKHVETIGMVMLRRNDGFHDALLLMGYEKSKKIDFLLATRVKSAREAITLWTHQPSSRVRKVTWFKDTPNSVINTVKGGYKNNQTMNLVQECGTNDIYIIATRKTGPGWRLSKGEQLLGLYRLNRAFLNHPVLERMAESKLHCNGFCNFAAGAGVYVSPRGKLALYGSNHYANGKDKFDAPNQPMNGGRRATIKAKWVVLKFAEFW